MDSTLLSAPAPSTPYGAVVARLAAPVLPSVATEPRDGERWLSQEPSAVSGQRITEVAARAPWSGVTGAAPKASLMAAAPLPAGAFASSATRNHVMGPPSRGTPV